MAYPYPTATHPPPLAVASQTCGANTTPVAQEQRCGNATPVATIQRGGKATPVAKIQHSAGPAILAAYGKNCRLPAMLADAVNCHLVSPLFGTLSAAATTRASALALLSLLALSGEQEGPLPLPLWPWSTVHEPLHVLCITLHLAQQFAVPSSEDLAGGLIAPIAHLCAVTINGDTHRAVAHDADIAAITRLVARGNVVSDGGLFGLCHFRLLSLSRARLSCIDNLN